MAADRDAASCPENDPLCDGEMVTPPGEPGYSYPCPARSAASRRQLVVELRHGSGTSAERREAMEIPWLGADALSEAIPPVYTEWIGEQLIGHLNGAEVAA